MTRPHFHKLILPNSIKDKKLRIPDTFVKRYGHDLSAFGRLSVPAGPVWPVGLIKADDKFWFHEGWPEFMERYAIRVGYFLVFRYEGHAVFTVHIFNLSTSEINYQTSTLTGRRYLAFEEMEDEDFVDNVSSSSTCFVPPNSLKRNVHSSKGASISQAADQTARAAEVQFNPIEQKPTPVDIKFSSPDGETPKPKKRGRKKLKVDPNTPQTTQQESEADMKFRFYESASARKRTVTAEERERAINAAKAFEPINPFCRVVLRPSYLYRGCIMYLPSCFAEKNLNGVCGFIKLQFSDRQWPVRCLYKGGRAKLSQGWYEFTLENNMGEGDVCIFELMKSRDVVLKVTVFRVQDGAMPRMN